MSSLILSSPSNIILILSQTPVLSKFFIPIWTLFSFNVPLPSFYSFLFFAMFFSASCSPLPPPHPCLVNGGAVAEKAGQEGAEWNEADELYECHSQELVSFILQPHRHFWGRWHGRDLIQGEIKHTLTNWSRPIWISFFLERHFGCHELKPMVLFIQSQSVSPVWWLECPLHSTFSKVLPLPSFKISWNLHIILRNAPSTLKEWRPFVLIFNFQSIIPHSKCAYTLSL